MSSTLEAFLGHPCPHPPLSQTMWCKIWRAPVSTVQLSVWRETEKRLTNLPWMPKATNISAVTTPHGESLWIKSTSFFGFFWTVRKKTRDFKSKLIELKVSANFRLLTSKTWSRNARNRTKNAKLPSKNPNYIQNGPAIMEISWSTYSFGRWNKIKWSADLSIDFRSIADPIYLYKYRSVELCAWWHYIQ